MLVATYGGIHYSNVLHELQQIVNPNGFMTIAAATVIAEHNAINIDPNIKIASGRPDAQDLSAISAFANQASMKALQTDGFENLVIQGKIPVPLRNKYPALPFGDKKCNECGICIKLCPVQAINDPRQKAGQGCIHCMRCTKFCPQKARTYLKWMKVGVRLLLSFVSRDKEKQSEFFI